MSRSSIYTLSDPRTGAVRYVGQSIQPRYRLTDHIREARKGSQYRCHRWISVLLSVGMSPKLDILEEVSRAEADAAETRWIRHYRADGAELTNHTAGGGGFVGHKQTPEQIAKRTASNTGKKRSGIALENLRRAAANQETKERLRLKRLGNKSRTGQRQSEEERAKRAASNRGKKRSPEFCELMRKKATGVVHSEATKTKMSETKRATITPERRSEIARIGNLASQEAKKCRSRAE